jgi:hypothetical protein
MSEFVRKKKGGSHRKKNIEKNIERENRKKQPKNRHFLVKIVPKSPFFRQKRLKIAIFLSKIAPKLPFSHQKSQIFTNQAPF